MKKSYLCCFSFKQASQDILADQETRDDKGLQADQEETGNQDTLANKEDQETLDALAERDQMDALEDPVSQGGEVSLGSLASLEDKGSQDDQVIPESKDRLSRTSKVLISRYTDDPI